MSKKSQFRKLIQHAKIIAEAIGDPEFPPADILSDFKNGIDEHGSEAVMKALQNIFNNFIGKIGRIASLILILDSETSAAKKPKKKTAKKKSTQKKARNKK